MVEGGSDGESSDMMVEDIDKDETLDPSQYLVSISNTFDSRPGMRPGWGKEWQTVDRQTKKRKKFSSGSVDNDSFMNLPGDEKLVCLFDSLNRNYEKLTSIEMNQKQCLNDNRNVKKGLAETNKKVDSLEKNVDMYAQKLKMLSYRSLDIESRSRRNNVIFWGISERLRYHDCKQLIHNLMRDQLFRYDRDFDPREMCIERAHRLGSLSNDSYRNKPEPKRPIIVRFRDYNDTELVMQRAYRLRNSVFSVDRDYPKEISQARKELQHSHSRTAVRNSLREVDMNVHVVLYLRACTYSYSCLISKICVSLTQIFLDMCIAVCLPGQLVSRYSFCVSDDLFYMLFLQ